MAEHTTDFSAWIAENIQRLKQSSPKFFTVWSRINTIVLALAGIPTLMDSLGIDISVSPPHWALPILKVATYAAAWGLFMSKLTVNMSHEVKVSDEGTLIQKPCGDLPYSEKKEDPKIIEPTVINPNG